jgi:hypothetical protein
MATKLNREALQHARKLIEGGDYVVDTDWSERQPSADQENRFLDRHDWDEYSKWYLAEESSEDRDNKGRYKFPFGDFRRVHRAGVIAAKQRAAQNDYPEVEKAADELLQLIDRKEGRES